MSRTGTPATAPGEPGGRRLMVALIVIVMAQLMVVLDATIVTTALPRIAVALGFSGTSLQWVVTGYAITFGGLLLLGGRAGDRLGRKRVFIGGLLLFSAASLAGGLAQDAGMLIAMRAIQGVGAALIAPTALALITTTFPEGERRNQAMGVYAAMSGSGAAIGLIAGGLLTTYASWRWVLFVNVPIGLVTVAAARIILPATPGNPRKLDIPGALAGTAGVAALVYGLSSAPTDARGVSHWGDPNVVIALVAAAVLLALFVLAERRAEQPLLPFRVLASRMRAGSYLTMLCLATGMFGIFFFLTLFMQDVLGFTPIQCGLGFLPFALTTIVMSETVSRFVARTGPRPLMLAGGVLASGGTLWFSTLTAHSGYAAGVLGPLIIMAAGFGLIFVPMTLTGTSGVAPADAGVAASLLNTGQQAGGAIGLAALGSVVWTVVADNVKHGTPLNAALADGFERGFGISFAIMLLALAVIAALIRQPCEVSEDQPVPIGCPGTHWRQPRARAGSGAVATTAS